MPTPSFLFTATAHICNRMTVHQRHACSAFLTFTMDNALPLDSNDGIRKHCEISEQTQYVIPNQLASGLIQVWSDRMYAFILGENIKRSLALTFLCCSYICFSQTQKHSNELAPWADIHIYPPLWFWYLLILTTPLTSTRDPRARDRHLLLLSVRRKKNDSQLRLSPGCE